MLRLGLITILIITVIGGTTWVAFPLVERYLPGRGSSQQPLVEPQSNEAAVTTLPPNLSSPSPKPAASPTPNPSPNDLLGRIKALEQAVSILQKTPSPAPQSSPTTTIINNAGPIVYYIPIGVGGYTSNTSWGNIPEQQITIDTSNFPGYKSAKLVVQMRTINALGTGYAILYNTSNKTQITPSQVTNVGSTASPAESASFQLTPGKNSYALQAQQTGGDQLYISFAYLKIVY